MTWFSGWYRSELERVGYRVQAPGEPIPLAEAIAAARDAGYLVVKTKAPEPPEVGKTWQPRRGTAEARRVVSFDVNVYGGWVFYGLQSEPGLRRCTLASWHKWVRKTRAKVAA